jgi:hypothetical protein
MQREGNILKRYEGSHKGVALVTAIAFLLIMVTIMGLMVSMTAQTSKRGGDIYFQEQAQLLAKSATEFALLAISGHDRAATNNCVNQINATYMGIYDINTTIRYIGLGSIPGCNSFVNAIATPESNGTAIIDVYVTLDAAAAGTTEDIRFHRRTMQKP